VGLDGIDGILGLSPKSEISANMLLFSQFYHDKVIPRNEYSLFLNDGNQESTIYFGGRDGTKIKKGSDSYSYELIDDYHWTILVNDMFYGDLSFFTNFYNMAVIDSGTSLMIMPPDDFAWLLEAVLSVDPALQQDKESGVLYYQNDCTLVQQVQYPIWAQFDSNDAFEIPVTSLWTNDLVENKNWCAFNVQTSNQEAYIFGDVFLRNYYTTFSAEKKTVTFAPSVNSTAVVQPITPYWTILFSSIVVILCCCMCISLGVKRYQD